MIHLTLLSLMNHLMNDQLKLHSIFFFINLLLFIHFLNSHTPTTSLESLYSNLKLMSQNPIRHFMLKNHADEGLDTELKLPTLTLSLIERKKVQKIQHHEYKRMQY